MMKKRIFITIVGLVVLLVVLVGIKGWQITTMIAQGKQFVPPPAIVTTASIRADSWETLLTAVGSLEAVQGVTVTAELSGKVVSINFESGTTAKAGDLLVQQDTASETAQLRAAEATATLARLNLERAKKLRPDNVISQSDLDNAVAQFNQADAQVDNLRAVIAKKTMRAPFAGRLGIRQINLGQIIKEGQAIVSLQALDPILVNFLLPQHLLAKVQPGLTVRVSTDALSGKAIEGKITAINPDIDAATRNIRVQAQVANVGEQLRPGMYATVAVVLPEPKQVLAIPATAVLYAPYSDSVFVVETKTEGDKPAAAAIRQQFVRLGEKRGDFVAVLSGLNKDDVVVSSGVFKLRNGQSVVVDNKLAPEFKLAPTPEES
jgi:membrane fusion protein, multidrug efflux system